MPYIFKQKLDISHLVNLQQPAHRILVAEPEQYLLALYASYLRAHNYEVAQCQELEFLEGSLKNFAPHLLIINAHFFADFHRLAGLLKNLKSEFAHFPIISLGDNLSGEMVKQLMELGVVSHIDRRFSRPGDIVSIAKNLLKY